VPGLARESRLSISLARFSRSCLYSVPKGQSPHVSGDSRDLGVNVARHPASRAGSRASPSRPPEAHEAVAAHHEVKLADLLGT
jgi:hypothetical protein